MIRGAFKKLIAVQQTGGQRTGGTTSEPTAAGRPWVRGGTLVLLCGLAFSTQAAARSAPESFADLAEKLLPSVVNISTTQAVNRGQSREFEEFFRDFFERRGEQGEEEEQGSPQRRRAPASLGSGFIIHESGFIVTNNHVIAEADEVTVRLYDDTTYSAEIIGRDEKTDLALLKVEPRDPLPAVAFGDSDELRIGDWVMAIGNPFGLGGTVTAGIVSARQRDINAGPYDDFIQSDAAINRGNSGGPMFNMDGEVVGVNTAIFSPSGGSVGIGFAIPSALAKNVIDQLRDGGTVRRGWLGVRIQTVTDELAEGLRLEKAHGALVAFVTEGGPAEAAGIQQGDVILRFNGREVEDMRKLPRMVAETKIGGTVKVVVWRKGNKGFRERTVTVQLGELEDTEVAAIPPRPERPGGTSSLIESLGMGLASMSPQLRQQFSIDEKADGVVITEVEDSGSAAEKGLRPGDVIVEVDQEEVKSPSDVADRVEKAKDEGYRVVTLLVLRQGDFQWVAVPIGNS